MNKTNIIGAIAVVALLLGAWASLFNHSSNPSVAQSPSGLVGNIAGGTVSPTSTVLPNPTVYDFLESRVALLADSQFMRGGATATSGIDQTFSIGSCASATSTRFAIANPFAASSTATVIVMSGAEATSTLFQVGTSTVNVGLTTSLVSTNALNATISTSSSAQYMKSGISTVASQTGNPIVVGPSDYFSAFSTSTFANAGAVNYTQPTCTYKVTWEI